MDSYARVEKTHEIIATFSIVAYDPVTEQWGVAVQSRFLAVGSVVPYAEAETGAIASQAWGNTAFGPKALQMMRLGVPADEVMKVLLAHDDARENRQVGIVDFNGKSSSFTGSYCQNWAGGITGEYFAVQGNILAGEQVVRAMADSYTHSTGTLAERLLAALQAGQDAGGDIRGMQSAAILVVAKDGGYSGYNDRLIDLRVDDHPTPIRELVRIYSLHESTFLAGAYVRMGTTALNEKKQEKADTLLNHALKIADSKPDDPFLLNQIAWEFAINNYKLDKALELAQKAVDLSEKKDGNVIDTLAEVYARKGNFKKAIELETLANTLNPSKEFEEKIKLWKQKRIK
jgi:uncharacterized Ntn-hydrolase superfamily protein